MCLTPSYKQIEKRWRQQLVMVVKHKFRDVKKSSLEKIIQYTQSRK